MRLFRLRRLVNMRQSYPLAASARCHEMRQPMKNRSRMMGWYSVEGEISFAQLIYKKYFQIRVPDVSDGFGLYENPPGEIFRILKTNIAHNTRMVYLISYWICILETIVQNAGRPCVHELTSYSHFRKSN